MTKITDILKDHSAAGALNDVLNMHLAIDDHTFVTKGGQIIQVLAVDGIDYECLDLAQLDQTARRFQAAVRRVDERFRIYEHLLKRNYQLPVSRQHDHPGLSHVVSSRLNYLRGRKEPFHTLSVYFSLVYEAWRPRNNSRRLFSELLSHPKAACLQLLSDTAQNDALEQGLDGARDLLQQTVASFVTQLRDTLPLHMLTKQEAFEFFRHLLNYAPHKNAGLRLIDDGSVDFQLCDSDLECYPDHLRLDDYYVKVLTLKQPPAAT